MAAPAVRAVRNRERIALAAAALLLAPHSLAHAGPLFRAPSLILDTRDMPLSVAMADFDGDSRQDLAVVVSGGVAVWRGNGDGTFRDRTDLDTGPVPRSVAGADLNRDGRVDLVTANAGDYPAFKGTVSVLFGNGDGTFQPAHVFDAGSYSLFLTIADVDGDGDLDVVAAGYTIAVLLNRGDGTLGAPFESAARSGGTFRVQATSSAQGSSPVGIADLNGDGRPDLVVANGGAERDYGCPDYCAAYVQLGNGDGTFGPAAGFGTGSRCAAVAVADFNQDGKPDVVVSNNYDRETTVSVLLGNGDGTLGSQRDIAADWSPYALAVADVNADGRPDIVVTNIGDGDYHPNSVSILLGAGHGNFTKSANLSVREFPTALAIGDLDGDGRLDLAVNDQYSNEVAILLGNGNGTFGTPEYPTGGWPGKVAIADMNGDGRPDVLTAYGNYYPTNGGAVSVRLGNGDGTLQAARLSETGSTAYDLEVADLNDDGFLDAVVAKAITSTVAVLLGNGDGTLRLVANLATGGSPYSAAIGDLNGDGRKDLAVAKTALNTVAVMLGNGDGSFGGQTEFAVGGAPTTVAIRDFDLDGRLDLFTVNEATNSISVLRGRGDGTFGDRIDHGIRGSPLTAAIGDLNGDGRLDLVLNKNNADSVSVLLGNGDGSFGVESGIHLWTSRVAIADFDGDGKSDLAALHDDYHAGSMSVLPGNGDGTFGTATGFGVAAYPIALETGDLDGNGRMDVVVASGYSVSLLLGIPRGATPVAMSLMSADAAPERVSLRWWGEGAASLGAEVYRRQADTDWQRLGDAIAESADLLRYEDHTVTAGARYAYRLGYREGAVESFTSETWVDVPAAFHLALDGFRPNPALGSPVLAFTLADGSPATIEVLDLAGRRVMRRDVGGLGEGRHVLALDGGARLAPGAYVMRLRQAGRVLTARGVVVR
jgi:hypothetical protein